MSEQTLYTPEEAAERLRHVSESQLRKKARSGEWPSHRNGRKRLFTQADLDEIVRLLANPRREVNVRSLRAKRRGA